MRIAGLECTQSFLRRLMVEPYDRSNEQAESLTLRRGLRDVLRRSDPALDDDRAERLEIHRSQRLVPAQLLIATWSSCSRRYCLAFMRNRAKLCAP